MNKHSIPGRAVPDISIDDILQGRRMRRNRKADWSRRLVRETELTVNDLIWPIFLVDGVGVRQDVESMPGVHRVSVDLAVDEAKRAADLGIPVLALFPYTDPDLRDATGSEALNDQNLVCEGTRRIRAAGIDIGVMIDVALDPLYQPRS